MKDVAVNVVANLAAGLIIFIVFCTATLLFAWLKKKKLMRVFSSDNQGKVTILLSRLQIEKDDVGALEAVNQGYIGTAISAPDFKAAQIMRDVLRSNHIVRLPSMLSDWIDKQVFAIRGIEPIIDVAPHSKDQVPRHNLILIGGPIYNSATRHFMNHQNIGFSIEKKASGERVLTVFKQNGEGVEISGRSAGRELAIIRKFYDKEYKRSVIMCIGLGASATFGSVKYISQSWEKIEKEYYNGEFCIILAFPDQPPNADFVIEPAVLYFE